MATSRRPGRRARPGRWTDRHLVGVCAATVGVGLHAVGAIDNGWAIVVAGLYVGAAAATAAFSPRPATSGPDRPEDAQIDALAATISRIRASTGGLPHQVATPIAALLAAAEPMTHLTESDTFLARAQVAGLLDEVEGALVRYLAVPMPDRTAAHHALVGLLARHRAAIASLAPPPAETALDELQDYLRAIPALPPATRPGNGSAGPG